MVIKLNVRHIPKYRLKFGRNVRLVSSIHYIYYDVFFAQKESTSCTSDSHHTCKNLDQTSIPLLLRFSQKRFSFFMFWISKWFFENTAQLLKNFRLIFCRWVKRSFLCCHIIPAMFGKQFRVILQWNRKSYSRLAFWNMKKKTRKTFYRAQKFRCYLLFF